MKALFGIVLMIVVLFLFVGLVTGGEVDLFEETGSAVREVSGSMNTDGYAPVNPIGEVGKFGCEQFGGRWVASIGACYTGQ